MESVISSRMLGIELTNGNDGRGSKWFKTAAVRKKLEKQFLAMGLASEPFQHPVRIRITRILGKKQRLWDADSIGRGNSKELIDALTAIGWFVDDSPKWITHCDFRQDSSQREHGPDVCFEVLHVKTPSQELESDLETPDPVDSEAERLRAAKKLKRKRAHYRLAGIAVEPTEEELQEMRQRNADSQRRMTARMQEDASNRCPWACTPAQGD